jgi:hypothetical protein
MLSFWFSLVLLDFIDSADNAGSGLISTRLHFRFLNRLDLSRSPGLRPVSLIRLRERTSDGRLFGIGVLGILFAEHSMSDGKHRDCQAHFADISANSPAPAQVSA